MDNESTGMPRWVRVFVAVTVAIVVVFGVLLLVGHGPGRHMSSHGPGGAAGPSVDVR